MSEFQSLKRGVSPSSSRRLGLPMREQDFCNGLSDARWSAVIPSASRAFTSIQPRRATQCTGACQHRYPRIDVLQQRTRPSCPPVLRIQLGLILKDFSYHLGIARICGVDQYASSPVLFVILAPFENDDLTAAQIGVWVCTIRDELLRRLYVSHFRCPASAISLSVGPPYRARAAWRFGGSQDERRQH